MTPVAPAPRSMPRRFERWYVGVLMGIGAFVLERLVMRSIRRSGRRTKEPEGTPLQSRGTTIEG